MYWVKIWVKICQNQLNLWSKACVFFITLCPNIWILTPIIPCSKFNSFPQLHPTEGSQVVPAQACKAIT